MVARVLSVAPLLVYAIFCILGLVQFHLWSQVVFMWNSDFTFAEKFFDFHGLRYFLVYPIFQIGQWLGLPYDRVFSVIVPALIFAIAYFSTAAIACVNAPLAQPLRLLVFAGICLILIMLSLFMNGRLMFAFTGSAILTWAMLDWDNNRDRINLMAVLAALFLSSVTSGTFLIVTAAFYFFLALNVVFANPTVCRRRILVGYALLLVLLVPFLTMWLLKNVHFYGGGLAGLFNMLDHGYGMLLLQSYWLPLLAGLVALAVLVYRFRVFLRRHWILASLVAIYFAGGLFGYSTALVVLPPLLVIGASIALLLLNRFLTKFGAAP